MILNILGSNLGPKARYPDIFLTYFLSRSGQILEWYLKIYDNVSN